MGKYREQTLSGSEWVQLGRVKMFFSHIRPTRMICEEQKVTVFGESTEISNLREIDITLDTPTTKFLLVDPSDNTPTGGDMSYRQLERAIYSLYYAKAQELDAAAAQTP